MASEKSLAIKEEQVKKLAEEIKASELVILADYRGITVDEVSKLRKDIRETNADYRVIKNNIIRRALNSNGENGLDELLEGPTAILLAKENYLDATKALYNFAKSHDFYKIKGGIIEGKVVTAEEIITIAKLPSRQELLAKLAGVLLGNITKLAASLNEVSKQKESAEANA